MDTCNNIVTEEADHVEEVEHIKSALRNCGYPDWTFKTVQKQIEKGPTKNKPAKSKDEVQGYGPVTICARSFGMRSEDFP